MADTKLRLKVSGLTFVALALLFVAGEVGLRLFGPEPAPESALVVWNPDRDEELRTGTGMHENDPLQLWRPRAGAPIPWGDGSETVNAAGYRGPLRDRAKEPGVTRIVTLGDSSTFGHSVGYEQSYSAVLEGLLRDAGFEAEVLCFGVVGSTAVQGLQRYLYAARDFAPDLVVVAFGAVNEHFAAPGFLSDEERIERVSVAQSGLGALRQRSRLLDTLARGFRGGSGDREPASTVGPISAGGSGNVAWDGVRRVSVLEYLEALRSLAREAESDGAKLCFVSMPRTAAAEAARPVLESYTRATHALATELQAPLADIRRLFADQVVAGMAEGELFVDGFHPTARGHRQVAEALAPLVLRLIER